MGLSTPCKAVAPDTPASGHSMGGGVAALIAMLLRTETRLLRKVCESVRAVCLAPAAVADLKLAAIAKEFIVSVINGQSYEANAMFLMLMQVYTMSCMIRDRPPQLL